MSTEMETGSDLDSGSAITPSKALVPALKREAILPSSDRGRLAAIVATCSLAGLAGGMALSMLAETHRAVEASRAAERAAAFAREPVTWLGIRIGDVAPHDCAGAIVRVVTPGSPAAKADFLPSDVVVSYGGDRVCNADQLVDVVRASEPGAAPEIHIRRGHEDLVLRPTLGVVPDALREQLRY